MKAFVGDPQDQELFKIIPFLIQLSKEEDVRVVSAKYKAFLEEEAGKKQKAKKDTTVSFDSSKGNLRAEESTDIMDEFENFEDAVNENSVIQDTLRDTSENSSIFSIMKTPLGFTKRGMPVNKSRIEEGSTISNSSFFQSRSGDSSGLQQSQINDSKVDTSILRALKKDESMLAADKSIIKRT